MDLIYTDPQRVEIGYFDHPQLDLAFGNDENDFELTIPRHDHCCEPGSYIYAEDTEYGGIVDGIKIDTAEDTVTYIGRTWHGILASKVIVPDKSGTAVTGVTVAEEDAKLVISGDANACLRWLIKRIGLDGLFVVDATAAGVNVSKYKFDRYCDAYKGIRGMLDSAGLRADILLQNRSLLFSAAKRYDYSVDQEFEGDLIQYRMKKMYAKPNHLVCLGDGEGASQIIAHLYADEKGEISETQTYTGLDEYTAIFDRSGGTLDDIDDPDTEENETEVERTEARERLIETGTEHFRTLLETDEIEVDFDADEHEYYIGDIVGAYESTTGESVSAAVAKKILRISGGKQTVSYEVLDPTPDEETKKG